MFKRILQFTLAFIAVGFFLLAPLACQQADNAADSTDTAKPAGNPSGKKLMAAKTNAKKAVDDAGEAVDDAGEALDDAGEALDDAGEAVDDVLEEGAEAIEDATEGH